jgi:hypothetical protein
MKFVLETLVDITQTNARKTDTDKQAYYQHQNFLTIIQTIGLRVNVNIVSQPIVQETTIKGFGSTFIGKHKVWTLPFEIEYEDALSEKMLKEDFNLVPIIAGLTESAQINKGIFRTKDSKERNIIFKLVDN